MILNLLSVFIIIICITYVIALIQEIFELYVKDLIKKCIDDNKEEEIRKIKHEEKLSLQLKKNKEEEEKRIYSLFETYMQKNKLDSSNDVNHSEE